MQRLHSRYVHRRRVAVLVEHLATIVPPHASVLDVGCGDGLLASCLMQKRADLRIVGVDVIIRRHTHIPVQQFDGSRIPWADGSFDVVMFVDVLHHTTDPVDLLLEARRVAQRAVVIKDHSRDGFLAAPTLRFMDWVGNAQHGVPLPYNYWPRQQWMDTFVELNLKVRSWKTELRLYPPPITWFFDRSLHFVARVDP